MKQRIVTAVAAGAVFLSLLVVGGYVFHGLLLIMALLGFDELVRMSRIQRNSFSAAAGYFGVILLVLPWDRGGWPLGIGAETWLWIAMLLIMSGMVLSKNRIPIGQASILLFGVVYIGFGFHYMAAARWGDDGLFWTALLFACIWVTDGGAYFTGNAIGKHPLWPSISPKKTVEGAVGGLVLSTLTAVAFSCFGPQSLDAGEAALLGLSIGIVGQVGDLIQSAYKRAFGVKDSGKLLPGHGGVLDRCDSWLIVFPFVHLVANSFG